MTIRYIRLGESTMLRKAVLLLSLVSSICSGMLALASEPAHAGKVYRVGVLGAATAAQTTEGFGTLPQTLQELGWANEPACEHVRG